jgi:ethanolamine utilization protein EutA
MVTSGESYALLSVGIDIGTTTTHLVFSRLYVVNLAGGSSVANFEIISREIIYESRIYFTPLIDENKIDLSRLKEIITTEYATAGIEPGEVKSGAVIITGEAALKENADEVAKILEGLAGDFVVALAGPDLEAILAGQGSGAQRISRREGITVANLDIGGGTTNIAVFRCGDLWDTATVQVGGRLFTFNPYSLVVNSVTKVGRQYADHLGVSIEKGRPLNPDDVEVFCQGLVDILDEVIERRNISALSKIGLLRGPLRRDYQIDALIFSGGVGHFVYENEIKEFFGYGDYGPYFAQMIKEKSVMLKRYHIIQPDHTLRATVIGAGVYSMKLSGSTIFLKKKDFLPLRNIPVSLVHLKEQENLENIKRKLETAIAPFQEKYPVVAIAITGWRHPKLDRIEQLAHAIATVKEDGIGSPLVVITEGNYGKVLGYLLENRLEDGEDLICLDEIKLGGGDFIDIGKPLNIGAVVPVIVKTLVFSN